MSNDYINPLSNLSYVNKDFQTIYPELLDLVKKLSKWDPSQSDESDPGVVLLKLCAIIADKNNYNIDKNVLECFPQSVSQEVNARPLFEQLGYNMRWYMSSTGEIAFKWIGETHEGVEYKYSIPRFTMFTDDESNCVFTLIEPVDILDNGDTIYGQIIQGTHLSYSVNGYEIITVADMDSNNRIYFEESNVAENGIFICNFVNGEQKQNYSDWKKVDNLSVESLSQTVYKFGVDRDGGRCYIEFPEDIGDLIGEGIHIDYLVTDGYNGNVLAKEIVKFYNDIKINSPIDKTSTITLSAETNVAINNFSSIVNGRDPESIESAYNNYKKTIGVFNTLVSVNDYTNFINRSKLVSNCVVSDRTFDIQDSYYIVSNLNEINRRILQVSNYNVLGNGVDGYILPLKISADMTPTEQMENVQYMSMDEHEDENLPENVHPMTITEDVETSEVSLNPFNLKLYALKWMDFTNTTVSYNNTFEILPFPRDDLANTSTVIWDDIIREQSGILSDIKCVQHDFVGHEPYKICILKNYYPLNIKIVPQYKLTELQQSDVQNNIKAALYNALNSQQIDFGEEIYYDYVYDTISESDNRIKSVVLDDIVYTTYAVYYDFQDNQYKQVAISDNFTDAYVKIKRNPITTKFEPVDPNVSLRPNELYLDNSSVGIADGLPTNYVYRYVNETDGMKLYSSFINDFRLTIFAKSVLNGNTQLMVPSTQFAQGYDQDFEANINDIAFLDSNTVIRFTEDVSEVTLSQNESIQLYAPNLINEIKYSNFIKVQKILNSTINANDVYELKDGEVISFYWRDTDSVEVPYKYITYYAGTVIKPDFTLIASDDSEYFIALKPGCADKSNGTVPDLTIEVIEQGKVVTYTYNSYLDTLIYSTNILSSTQSISIQKVNEVIINKSSRKCYWVLETTDPDGNYVLFDATTLGEQSRILKDNEYFFYTNSSGTSLLVLGSGSKIVRRKASTSVNNMPECFVRSVDYDQIIATGTSALTEDDWYTIPNGIEMAGIEMQYIALGEGVSVRVSPNNPDITKYTVTFDNSGCSISAMTSDDTIVDCALDDFSIEYKEESQTDFTKIPNIASVSMKWDGRSSFDINLSSTVAQEVKPNQSIKLYAYGTDKKPKPDKVLFDIHNEEKSLFVLCNKEIKASGGNSIQVFDNDGTKLNYASMYIYSSSFVDSPYISYTQDYMTVTFDNIDGDTATEKTIEIPFRIPSGTYIVEVQHNCNDISDAKIDVTLKYSDDEIYEHIPLSSITDGTIDISKNGVHYLSLDISEHEQDNKKIIPAITMYISATIPAKSRRKITIKKLFGYDRTIFGDIEFQRIFDKVQELDKNNLYNYTYVVDKDEEIENPLDALSFMDKNHIFNKFTICQINTANTKVYVTNKIK